MELRSGTTLEHIIRKGILTAMVLTFTALFALDGYGGGYAKANLKEARERWNIPDEASLSINEKVTKDSKSDFETIKSLSELEQKYGKPSWVDDDKAYYFGPAVRVRLGILGDLVVSEPEVEDSVKHNDKDIATQKMLTIVLGILCIPLSFHYFRVLTYKAILTDEGIKLPGKPFVPFDAMKSMDGSDFKKGLMDVNCEVNGTTETLRFDNYKLKEFRPFVEAVFEKKEWENLFLKTEDDD